MKGSLLGSATNADGEFELQLPEKGVYSLSITALGFQNQEVILHYLADPQPSISIMLVENTMTFPEVLILGKSDRQFSKIPGSASYISTAELKNINPLSGNEVLRRSPGVHVSDEEGAGMRANIGIRGLDPDRSRSLLVLEDGVPVALAPYGEPEMYYTPPIDRMSGVEILKGSGQILYGPQTIGGVVNYLTKTPPETRTANLRVQGGQGGYYNVLGSYGNTIGRTGLRFSVLRKGAKKLGLTSFGITDVLGKMSIQMNPSTSFALKLGFYDETSNSTYLGLTQTMYNQGGLDFEHMAPDDLLRVRRYHVSGHFDQRLSKALALKTIAFAYTTSRDWRRQDFVSNDANDSKPSNWTGVSWGDEAITGGAVYMRNTTGNRNRHFEVAGLESSLTLLFKAAGVEHQLKAGIRYMAEKTDEQRINGTKYNAVSGSLTEDEDRKGRAFSAYVQNQANLHERFAIHAGVRMENFIYERDIFRRTFRIGNQNLLRDTLLVSENAISQLIPGAGFTWKLAKNTTLFGGVHTGFAPPRTKDAISDTGEVYELNAERSVNAELGFRSAAHPSLNVEMTAFYMDFSNQVIPVSESSGGTGTGLVNGGQTLHQGIEAAFALQLSTLAGWTKTGLSIDANVTWSDAIFTGDRTKEGVRLAGNKTPYAPEWLVNSAITLELFNGFGARITGNYTGQQFADELNTIQASADGRNGLIPSFYTVDANAFYKIKNIGTTIQLSVKNLTDERYIASRRPQGIRVGLARFVSLGIEASF
ncbi:MAG: TonB-dependent receptor [Saprospiraceae bacterium]|nr:TonB-dependent receptor [Saprospiraceae bacterium]